MRLRRPLQRRLVRLMQRRRPEGVETMAAADHTDTLPKRCTTSQLHSTEMRLLRRKAASFALQAVHRCPRR